MKYNKFKNVSFYLLGSAIMCAFLILSSAEILSAISIADIHILKIVPEDERAIMRTPVGDLRIIKSGDSIGDQIKVIRIEPGAVVLEEKKNQSVSKVTIHMNKGKRVVTREAKPARMSKLRGMAPVVVKHDRGVVLNRDREDKSSGIDHRGFVHVRSSAEESSSIDLEDSVDVGTGAAESSKGKLYRWVDEQGVVHLSDKPGSSDAEIIEMSDLPSSNTADSLGEIVVKGQLLYGGEPLSLHTDASPAFRIKSKNEEQWYDADYSYDNKGGNFSIYVFAEGGYSLYVYVEASSRNPTYYPGDYKGSASFSVSRKLSQDVEVDMERIMHLIEPQDNAIPLVGFELPCKKKVAYGGPVSFRWEEIGEDVKYTYTIYRWQCEPFKLKDKYFIANTRGTEIEFDLPPNEENEIYSLELSARKNDRKMGVLTTHGVGSFAWGYRFRVVDQLFRK